MTKEIVIPKEELKHLYWDLKLSGEQIAPIYNCKPGTIITKMHNYGIPIRNAHDRSSEAWQRPETRIKMLNANKNRSHECTIETKNKISKSVRLFHAQLTPEERSEKYGQPGNQYFGGHTHTEESKQKIRNSLLGEKCYRWKDGASKRLFEEKYKISNYEWKRIAQKVRLRDNFTCAICGCYPATDVHHIIPARIMVDNSNENLVTLCDSCHRKLEHYTEKKLDVIQDVEYLKHIIEEFKSQM
jgi:transcription elongation factor Elf1